MGMPIEVDLRDETPSDIEPVFDWFREVDSVFSTYKAESQISRFNSGSLAEGDLDTPVRDVLRRCEELREVTDGYFDVRSLPLPLSLIDSSGQTITHGIDPSGYVKGWAVDRAADQLRGLGARNFLINAGGDLRVAGGALPQASWRVGIQHPLELDKTAAVVEANDLAVATSGEYIRGRHILNPHTARAPEGVLSVTVVGPDLGEADAYATAAFAMGDEGPRWTMSLDGYQAMTILAHELVLYTPGFPRAEE